MNEIPLSALYSVATEKDAWSYIIGPNGYREGPIRYRWEAIEWAKEMNETVFETYLMLAGRSDE